MHRRALLTLFKIGTPFHRSNHSWRNTTLNYSQFKQVRQYYKDEQQNMTDQPDTNKKTGDNALIFGMKYTIFQDADAPVILDAIEEEKIQLDDWNTPQEVAVDPFEGLNMKRGLEGVFDIKDLVDVLKKDNAKNVFVIKVPQEYSYVDYLVIATGKSQRHMVALAEFVRLVYKNKKWKHDLLPKIEGKACKDWIAMDLGNIALHIFSSAARKRYDLETLWSVGPDYDDVTQNSNEEIDLMDQYNAFLNEYQPANNE